jgi:hypothetical protein
MIIKGGDKLKEFIATVAKQKARVDVGFFEDSTYSNGTPIAEVAIYQEFGTESIPPRPFMQPTFNNEKAKWADIMRKKIISQGEHINAYQVMQTVGLVAMTDVKDKINWWAASGSPRNAEATINKKGFDSPLIQDGTMRDAVRFKVTS